MKTKLQIIDETVEFYSKDISRRAISTCLDVDCDCVYRTSDNKKCAVGRCANSKKLNELYKLYKVEPTLSQVLIILKKDYLGHEYRFWEDLQWLHDCDSHWNNKSLTIEGKQYVEKLKQKYS